MRFDDSLKTVLAADTSSAFGARSAFRQIVDLMARGRIPPAADTIERLRALRTQVDAGARAASARGLVIADPPPELVAFFAEDDAQVAAPVLRGVRLDDAAWAPILAGLGPAGRAVLRDRKDLPAETKRALESFGTTDFTLGYSGEAGASAPELAPPAADTPAPRNPAGQVDQPVAPPMGAGPFVSLGAVARELPVVAEALRVSAAPAVPTATGERFEIADLVERIETFQRDRETLRPAPERAATFRFTCDPEGVIDWADGVERGAVVGTALLAGGAPDPALTAAFRRRSICRDATIEIGGSSDAAGRWRVSLTPAFEARSGRFVGMRGAARRIPDTAVDRAGAEALRRLAHELRTPTNAISGFAELIESEMLGPVDRVHRDRAGGIRRLASDLVDAIEDLDTAARLDSAALAMRADRVALAPVLANAAMRLEEAAHVRGVAIEVSCDPALTVTADVDALRRLIARVIALRLAQAMGGTLRVVALPARDVVIVTIEAPGAADPAHHALSPGDALLGPDFVARLAARLAAEVGGALEIGPQCLTLRVPAGLNREVQAATH